MQRFANNVQTPLSKVKNSVHANLVKPNVDGILVLHLPLPVRIKFSF